MKTWSKCLYRLSLVSAICGLTGTQIYAQQNKVEQLEENLTILENTKIYGKGSLGAGFTINNYSSAKNDFSPALIVPNGKKNPNPKVNFGLDVRLGLKRTVKFHEKDIKFDILLGFDAEGKTSIKNAFAEFENWLIGLQISSFADADVLPNMIGGLPSSAVFARAMQLRWKQQINPTYSYAISLEKSAKFDLHPSEKDAKLKSAKLEKPNNDYPVLAGNVRYHYDNNLGHMQLGALGRILEYYHTKAEKTYMSPGFGVNLGTQVNLVSGKTIFKTNGVYGKGLGGYIMDLALLEDEVNTAYVLKSSNELKTIDAWGAYLDLEHRWTPEVRVAGSVGVLSTIGNDDREKTAYKTGYYGAVKLCYHPTDQFHFGVGYLVGSRHNENEVLNSANRIQFESSFSF